jgi:hypothetical protein
MTQKYTVTKTMVVAMGIVTVMVMMTMMIVAGIGRTSHIQSNFSAFTGIINKELSTAKMKELHRPFHCSLDMSSGQRLVITYTYDSR